MFTTQTPPIFIGGLSVSTGGTGSFPISNLSVDPGAYDKCVVYGGNGGMFERLVWAGNSLVPDGVTSVGTLGTVTGLEKNSFWISRAGKFQHDYGRGFDDQAVYHSCSHWSYNNSVRASHGKPPIAWVNPANHPWMHSDGCYPCVVSDNIEPQKAYMLADYTQFGGPGLVMNIWRGTNNQGDGYFQFDPNGGLLIIDPNGTSGMPYYAPQLCPAKVSGAWVCYTVGGYICVRYVPSDATTSADLGPITRFPGTRGAICEDRDGHLHVAYSNNGICYRKLEVVARASRGVSVTDYDGDRKSDFTICGIDRASDPNALRWNIRKSRDGSYVSGNIWGDANSTPIRADFNGDGVAEVAVYQKVDHTGGLYTAGTWYISDTFGASGMTYQFGDANSIPAAADFDGDGSTELAVYQRADHADGAYRAGTWYIYSLVTGVGRIIVWGNADFLPAAADYDNDGEADPAVFNPATGQWYIDYSSATGARSPFIWGNADTEFLVGDFTADGIPDLAAVVPGTTRKDWYTCDYTDMGVLNNTENFGTLASTLVMGDWDRDGVDDMATYEGGSWEIRQSGSRTTWRPTFGTSWTAPLSQFHR